MKRRRELGNILILVIVLTLMLAGLASALLSTVLTFHRGSRDCLNREMAYRTAESGVGYYLIKLAGAPDYFDSNPAPHDPMTLGGGSFQLESAQSIGADNQWQVLIGGTFDGTPYRLKAVIGHRRIPIPDGIVVVGTNNPSDVVIRLESGTRVDSYDPAVGAYDPAFPGEDADVASRGSLSLTGTSTVYGDVSTMGTSTEGSGSSITGEVTEDVSEIPVEDIDPIVYDAMNASQASNNNAVLAGIFGSQWTSLSGSQNYGDLIVTVNSTYAIPSGTYRFRRFEVRSGATVVFETSAGPSRLVYVGSGTGTGTLNDLIVTGGGSVLVDPKDGSNGLLTVLGPDCDFIISSNSIFGQTLGDPENAGYTQIISLGGDSSSDDIQVTGGSKVYGRLYAASHLFTLDGAWWYGSALARTITLRNSTFAVDLGSLGSTLVDPSRYDILAMWPDQP